MPESLTRKKTPPTTARVADFKSEWWPDLFRNGGHHPLSLTAHREAYRTARGGTRSDNGRIAPRSVRKLKSESE
jgi:hypothetical protein